jgi:hypothetical protein
VRRVADILLGISRLQDGIKGMALTTPHEIATLNSWSWLRDYRANRATFIDFARILYQVFAKYAASASPPIGPDEMEGPLTVAIQTCDIFKHLCATKQHARPDLYPVFARLLAKYIIDHEWPIIIGP